VIEILFWIGSFVVVTVFQKRYCRVEGEIAILYSLYSHTLTRVIKKFTSKHLLTLNSMQWVEKRCSIQLLWLYFIIYYVRLNHTFVRLLNISLRKIYPSKLLYITSVIWHNWIFECTSGGGRTTVLGTGILILLCKNILCMLLPGVPVVL